MRKNKKLFIVYWNLGLGGIQKRIRDLVNFISHDNWEIYLLLRNKAKEGFETEIRPISNVHIHYYPYVGKIRMPLGFIFWIAGQYLKIKPDVALTFQYRLSSVMVVLRKLFFRIRCRLVINEGAVVSGLLRFEGRGFGSLLIRLTYASADMIIVPTKACKDDLTKNFSVPPGIIKTISNWTLFPALTSLKPDTDIVYVGRIDREKNPLSVVNIARKLKRSYPHIRIKIIGNGTMLNEVHEAVKAGGLNENIEILPFSLEINKILRKTKLIIVPSFNEGMPNVVLEAAMCRVPAVVRNFSGADEVVKEGETGYIYSTTEEAISRLNYLLGHEKQRRQIGKKAQNYISKNFSGLMQKKFISILLN